MIDEGRKRGVAANAFLGLALAASAAQSPEDFVRTGHIEAPGTALMQTWGKKRREAERNLDQTRVSQASRNRKKKTFKEFVEKVEISESSSGEIGQRRLSSRGPAANRSDRNKQKQDKSNRAALSKAGFSRSPRPITGKGGRGTKWTETSTSSHHSTETGTKANQSDYAASVIGNLGPKGNKPTSIRALKAKQIRKQFGGDRTPRPVHDVSVNKKRTYNDVPDSTMTKGRSFKKEVTQGVPSNLEKAGAKPGDIITSTPTSASRSRMYGRTHNTRTNRNTGITVNRVRRESVEESYLIEGQSREEAEKKRLAKPNPDEWRVRKVGRAGEESWTTKTKSAIAGQGTRRRAKLKALTYKEFLAFTKRNLKPNPADLAKAAQKNEVRQKAAQTREAQQKTQETGTKHVVDHNQPQQDKRKPENRERFDQVVPGDVSSNRSVLPEPKNLAKGSKPPKKGEPGYGKTRSGAIRKLVKQAEGVSEEVGPKIATRLAIRQKKDPKFTQLLIKAIRQKKEKKTAEVKENIVIYQESR